MLIYISKDADLFKPVHDTNSAAYERWARALHEYFMYSLDLIKSIPRYLPTSLTSVNK